MIVRLLITLFFISQLTPCYSQESDAELISQKTNVIVRNGKLYTSISYQVLIKNRDGELYTHISIPYSKLCKLTKLKAYIKDTRGNIIRKLRNRDINNRSAISSYSFYEDDYIKEFTLKHNVYPYIISYSYTTIQKEFVSLAYWFPVLDTMIPTQKAELNISIPKDYIISCKSHLIDKVKIDSVDSRINYRWEASYKGHIKNELFSPSLSMIVPSVNVVPQKIKFEYEASFLSWLSYGNWQYELIRGLSDLPEREKSKFRKLVEGIDDNTEKVKVLYHYLQDVTRYINISIDTGGLKPYPASYVALNKYGDCKALTNYLKSALESIGIKSYYTTVYAGSTVVPIQKDIPSQQFNHVILNVPLQNDTLWLDCTSDGAFNHLGTFTQNRNAFVVDCNKSKFMRTPSLSKEDVLELRNIDISISNSFIAQASFNNLYKGDKYESLFALSNSIGDSRKLIIIRNRYIEDGFDLSEYRIKPHDRDSSKISLLYSAQSNKIYNRYGNDLLINLIPFSVPSFKSVEIRKLPVQLDYPIYKRDTITYVIPDGYNISSPLKNQDLHTSFGEYSLEFHVHKKEVSVIKSMLLNAQHISLDKYKEFYRFLYMIYEIENTTSIVTTKE